MRIAIDIDGVVAEFAGLANDWMANESGQPRQPINSWDWYKQYDKGTRLWSQFWAALHDEPSIIGTAGEVPGAFDGLMDLGELGHEFDFVTARSEEFREVTDEWLGYFFVSGESQLIMEPRKWRTGHDLYLDDHLINVLDCRARNKHAVLFLREHNLNRWLEHAATMPAVADWPHFVSYVEQLDAA